MRILHRYLLKEIGIPLLLWVGFLFALLLVMQLLRGTDVLLGSAVTLLDFGRLIAFLTPHFLLMALPIAFLLSILLGLGRLAEDRELVALQASGVGLLQILAVPLVMSAVLGAGMWVLAARLDPWGQVAVKRAVAEIIKRNVIGDVKPGLFFEDITNLTIYAEKVDAEEGAWTNVLIHDGRDARAPLLVLAHHGTIDPAGAGAELNMELRQGQVHRAEGAGNDYSVINFERGLLSVGVVDSIVRQDRFRISPRDELTPSELLQAAREAPTHHDDPRPYLVSFFGRLAQVWTPAAFALLAGPLAMSRRQARGRSYFLAILGYVAYYVLARTCENWGVQGKLAPWLGGTGASLLFAVGGLIALARVTRRGTVR